MDKDGWKWMNAYNWEGLRRVNMVKVCILWSLPGYRIFFSFASFFLFRIWFSNVQLELLPKYFTRWKLNEFEIDWKIEISRPKNLDQRQQVHGTIPMHREISEMTKQFSPKWKNHCKPKPQQMMHNAVKRKSRLKVNLWAFHNTHNSEKDKDSKLPCVHYFYHQKILLVTHILAGGHPAGYLGKCWIRRRRRSAASPQSQGEDPLPPSRPRLVDPYPSYPSHQNYPLVTTVQNNICK